MSSGSASDSGVGRTCFLLVNDEPFNGICFPETSLVTAEDRSDPWTCLRGKESVDRAAWIFTGQ